MWAMVTTLALVYPRGPARPHHHRPRPVRGLDGIPTGRPAPAVHLSGTAGRTGAGGRAGAAIRQAGTRPVRPIGDRAGQLLRPGRDRRRRGLDRRLAVLADGPVLTSRRGGRRRRVAA